MTLLSSLLPEKAGSPGLNGSLDAATVLLPQYNAGGLKLVIKCTNNIS